MMSNIILFICLLLVQAQYFSRKYLKQSDWTEMWKKALKAEYNPVVHVTAIKKDKDPQTLIPEILKYCVKESDLLDEKEWFLEFTRQIHRVRMISVGGVLREYLRVLEEEPRDFIGQDDEDDNDEVRHNYYVFSWRKQEKKYRLFRIFNDLDEDSYEGSPPRGDKKNKKNE